MIEEYTIVGCLTSGILHAILAAHPEGRLVIYEGNSTHYYFNGRRHREGLPAITNTSGEEIWYFNGLLHNTLGPAIKAPTGFIEYWIRGSLYTEKQFHNKLKEEL